MSEKIESFLIREPGNTFSLWFCRGPGKCTLGTKKRTKLSKQNKHCADCVKGADNEMLQELMYRIKRGDA